VPRGTDQVEGACEFGEVIGIAGWDHEARMIACVREGIPRRVRACERSVSLVR
jgi:hypothetical protein